MTKTEAMSWQMKALKWCESRMAAHFARWKETPEGKRWSKKSFSKTQLRRSRNGVSVSSPYSHGFYVPESVKEMQEALNKNDEHLAKSIMMHTSEDNFD